MAGDKSGELTGEDNTEGSPAPAAAAAGVFDDDTGDDRQDMLILVVGADEGVSDGTPESCPFTTTTRSNRRPWYIIVVGGGRLYSNRAASHTDANT